MKTSNSGKSVVFYKYLFIELSQEKNRQNQTQMRASSNGKQFFFTYTFSLKAVNYHLLKPKLAFTFFTDKIDLAPQSCNMFNPLKIFCQKHVKSFFPSQLFSPRQKSLYPHHAWLSWPSPSPPACPTSVWHFYKACQTGLRWPCPLVRMYFITQRRRLVLYQFIDNQSAHEIESVIIMYKHLIEIVSPKSLSHNRAQMLLPRLTLCY